MAATNRPKPVLKMKFFGDFTTAPIQDQVSFYFILEIQKDYIVISIPVQF